MQRRYVQVVANTNRKKISAPIEAALWTLSNGRCYAPTCDAPVIVEVRPGVPRKNAQVAHVYGVEPAAPRYRAGMSVKERDSFPNLLLLCLPDHAEVDDRKSGEKLYPPEKLLQWKTDHEGGDGPLLAQLGAVDGDRLLDALAELFSPPLERLESIADELERTGRLNATSVDELRRIVAAMTEAPDRPDQRTAGMLYEAATMLQGMNLRGIAEQLHESAGRLGSYR